MNREKNIDKILDELIKSGSEIDYLKSLKDRSLDILKKDVDLSDVLNEIAKEIKEQTEEFLNQKNQYGTNYISGISTCIYLPDFKNNGEYKLKLIGGNTTRNSEIKVNERTMFDVASITITSLSSDEISPLSFLMVNSNFCGTASALTEPSALRMSPPEPALISPRTPILISSITLPSASNGIILSFKPRGKVL